MVQVLVHLERASEGGLRWWAESDDRPGFFAVAASLDELRFRVLDALRDIETEDERDPDRLEVAFHLAPTSPYTETDTRVTAAAGLASSPPSEPAGSSRSTSLVLHGGA